ncbi:hypothetical protein GCM10020256_61500 [Streptomyces thermocoprophilus]
MQVTRKQRRPEAWNSPPFRGLRYDPDRVGSLAAVTSPPYDVVVRPDGLHHLEAADPYNIVRLILPQARTPPAPAPSRPPTRCAAGSRRGSSPRIPSPACTSTSRATVRACSSAA